MKGFYNTGETQREREREREREINSVLPILCGNCF